MILLVDDIGEAGAARAVLCTGSPFGMPDAFSRPVLGSTRRGWDRKVNMTNGQITRFYIRARGATARTLATARVV